MLLLLVRATSTVPRLALARGQVAALFQNTIIRAGQRPIAWPAIVELLKAGKIEPLSHRHAERVSNEPITRLIGRLSRRGLVLVAEVPR